MNHEEIGVLITYAAAACPAQQRRDLAMTVKVWGDMIGHLPYDVALGAVKLVIAEKNFFPAVSEILTAADAILNPGRLTAADAWAEVMRAVRGMGWTGNPKWSCPAVEKAVAGLGGWQYICASTETMADRAHFMRMYDTEARRQKEQATMPPALRDMIAQIQIKALPGGTNGGDRS